VDVCSQEAINFFLDGNKFIYGGGCSNLFVREIDDSDLISSWINRGAGSVQKIVLDEKGHLFAVSSNGAGRPINIYDSDYTHLNTFELRTNIENLAFGPEDDTITSVSYLGDVTIWDLNSEPFSNSWKKKWKIDGFSKFAFSQDGSLLAAGSGRNSSLSLWNVSNGELITTFSGGPSYTSTMAFHPDNTILATANNDGVNLWNITDSSLIKSLGVSTDGFKHLVFSPDGKILVSAGNEVIRMWNLTDSSLLGYLTGHTGRITDLAFHPDGLTLGSASEDNSVIVWNLVEKLNSPGDDDNDGILDEWENLFGLNPSNFWDKFQDEDTDDLTNIMEFQLGTNPLNNDSDSDKITDGYEYLNNLNTTYDDSNEDKDGDSLSNYYEFQFELYANVNDSHKDKDNDGLSNYYEFLNDLLPNNPDSDNDSLSDGDEVNTYLTNPHEKDTDIDKLPDGWEIEHSLNPLNQSDALLDFDSDDLSNLDEYYWKTDPNNSDTDGDGMLDGYEVKNGFDPLKADALSLETPYLEIFSILVCLSLITKITRIKRVNR
jgi:WD40 repeat protein